MLARGAALAVAAILAFAAPVWGSGHGHGHKRRSGGLLGRLRRTSSQQVLGSEAKESQRINSAVGAVLSAVKAQEKSADTGSMAPPIRKK